MLKRPQYKSSLLISTPKTKYWILILCVSLIYTQDEAWEYIGLNGEQIRSIVIDRYNDSIIYVGSTSTYSGNQLVPGKILKSNNGGETWNLLLIGINVREIVQHPSEPLTFFATLNPSLENISGIIKTVNGGVSWNYLNTDTMGLNWETGVATIAIDPIFPEKMYVGTSGVFGGYFFRSLNGGASWELQGFDEILDNNMSMITINPLNTNIIFLGTVGDNHIYKSTNFGVNWESVWMNYYGSPMEIVIDYQNPNIIYATQSYNTLETPGIIKSVNGGLTWEPIIEGINGISVYSIIIHPTQSGILYAGTNYAGIYKTLNAGESWFPINRNLPYGITIRTLALNTTGTRIYSASSFGDGIFRSNILMDQDNCSLLGDLNDDGGIDVLDIIQTINCILNNLVCVCADLNGDVLVNIQDIVLIVNIILEE